MKRPVSRLTPALVMAAMLVGALTVAACSGTAPSAIVTPASGSTEPATGSTASPTTPTVVAPTAAAEATTTTRGLRRAIVLGFAGDTSFTNGLSERDPFGAVTSLLQAPDFMMVNLETAVADSDVGQPPVPKPFLFRSPPESVELLINAGIDAVSLANNHTLDFGQAALEQTLVELDARRLPHVGGGIDEAAAYEPLIVPVGDWIIGVVGLSRVPCDWSASGANVRPQVAWACDPFLDLADRAIAQATAEADVVVVLVHGGEEGVFCPSEFMVELNRRWSDLGVDLVVNGHPHVVQGITSHGETLVVNSTGNFAFPPARGVTANSGIFTVEITEARPDAAPQLSLTLVPLRADGGVLSVPSESQAAAIFEQVNAVSHGWTLDVDGRAVADPEHIGSC